MLIVNVILILAAIGLGYKLRADWKEAARRQQALAATAPAAPLAAGLLASPQPAGGLEAIVAGNLFFSDRNNELPKAAEKRAAPPQPLLIGTMNLGRTKLALLVEANQPSATPRQVKEGETFAGYVVVEIGNNQVVLEWEGARRTVDVTMAPVQVSAPVSAPAAASAPSVASTASAAVNITPGTPPPPDTARIIPGKQGPSDQFLPGSTSRMAYAGDPLPPGTIINGYMKVERASPFGKEMWWQKVEQSQPKKDERKPQ
jgi:hypothetical protein